MNGVQFGGWVQIIMGLLGAAVQAYQLFTGGHTDPVIAATSLGVAAGGAAHLANGRK